MLLCQYKLHMKPTPTLYSVIQQCQVDQIFVFYGFYCNLKEKYHIRRNINGKIRNKKNVYMWNQYYFDLLNIRVCQACTTKNKVAFALTLNYFYDQYKTKKLKS